MELVKTIESVRKYIKEARSNGKKIGFVPTMGALHIGHISLIRVAAKDCDFVVVSIFVNPTQFTPGEDYEKYPRPIDKDLEICEQNDVDLVFLPEQDQMYPNKNLTWVDVEKLTEPLCGRFRPGHFQGVTTVCAKLFNIILPDAAYFGQKDAQQAIVIKKMVADLNMPLEIVICPTIREPSGLAVSSRNNYLTEHQRKDAAVIYKSLQKCQNLVETGTTSVKKLTTEMDQVLKEVPSIEIQYVNILNAETLEEIEKVSGKVLIAVAANIGPARLIDNIIVDVSKQ
jgi:pantoate--beta-alanine ligase